MGIGGVHLLLLGLWAQLGLLQALTCLKCGRVGADGACETGESRCRALAGQRCFLRKVYTGGRLQYGHQGCSSVCIPMSFFRPGAGVDFLCCGGTSLCNRL